MPKTALKKEKWTLSFDPRLKNLLIKEARKKGIYPVNLLEEIVRERYNPFGYADIKNSVSYIQSIRKDSKTHTDEEFLNEIRKWQKTGS